MWCSTSVKLDLCVAFEALTLGFTEADLQLLDHHHHQVSMRFQLLRFQECRQKVKQQQKKNKHNTKVDLTLGFSGFIFPRWLTDNSEVIYLILWKAALTKMLEITVNAGWKCDFSVFLLNGTSPCGEAFVSCRLYLPVTSKGFACCSCTSCCHIQSYSYPVSLSLCWSCLHWFTCKSGSFYGISQQPCMTVLNCLFRSEFKREKVIFSKGSFLFFLSFQTYRKHGKVKNAASRVF